MKKRKKSRSAPALAHILRRGAGAGYHSKRGYSRRMKYRDWWEEEWVDDSIDEGEDEQEEETENRRSGKAKQSTSDRSGSGAGNDEDSTEQDGSYGEAGHSTSGFVDD